MDISIALGGGGSRGYAHIGVLRRLEQEGFRIRAVAGTSAGGIIAACYAAGYHPDEIEQKLVGLDQSKLIWRRAPRDSVGLLGLSGAEEFLTDLLGERTFADLRIPCAVCAVDTKTNSEIVLNQGRVVDAVLATIAIPGVFPPRPMGDYLLVDGGVLDPVPVSVARMLAPRLPSVAVILGPAIGAMQLPVQIPLFAPVMERLTHTRVVQAMHMFLQTFDITTRRLAEMRLKEDDPDVIIRPDLHTVGVLDDVDVPAVIRCGDEATAAVLPQLQQAVAWPNRARRRLFPARRGA